MLSRFVFTLTPVLFLPRCNHLDCLGSISHRFKSPTFTMNYQTLCFVTGYGPATDRLRLFLLSFFHFPWPPGLKVFQAQLIHNFEVYIIKIVKSSSSESKCSVVSRASRVYRPSSVLCLALALAAELIARSGISWGTTPCSSQHHTKKRPKRKPAFLWTCWCSLYNLFEPHFGYPQGWQTAFVLQVLTGVCVIHLKYPTLCKPGCLQRLLGSLQVLPRPGFLCQVLAVSLFFFGVRCGSGSSRPVRAPTAVKHRCKNIDNLLKKPFIIHSPCIIACSFIFHNHNIYICTVYPSNCNIIDIIMST